MTSLGRKMARGAGWTVALSLGERLIGLASTLVLARLLVPADFGLVAMATSIVAVLEALSAFGFEVALIQQQTRERSSLDTAWTMNALIGLVKAAILCALIPVAVHFYNESRIAPIMAALALSVAVAGCRNIGMVLYEQDLRFGMIFALSIGKKLASVTVTLSLALVLHNYWALVAGMLTATFVDLILSYVLHPYRPRAALSERRSIFAFSKWLLLNNVLFFLSNRGADFVIGNRSGPAALGTYSIAYEFANLPTTELVRPIVRAVYPGFARLASDPQQLAQSFRTVFGLVALFSFPAAAGIATLAAPIVSVVLGPKWTEAAPLIESLALFGVLRALQGNMSIVYIALGQPYVTTGLMALYVALGLGSFSALLWRYDLPTAVWGLVVSAAFVAVLNFALLGRKLALSRRQLLGMLVRPVLAALLMSVVVVLLRNHWWAERPWLEQLAVLGALVLTGATTYVAGSTLLWWLVGRPPGAESMVLDLLRRRFARTKSGVK